MPSKLIELLNIVYSDVHQGVWTSTSTPVTRIRGKQTQKQKHKQRPKVTRIAKLLKTVRELRTKAKYPHLFQVNTDFKYVIKYVPFESQSDTQGFTKEVFIGSIKGIESVGVRVHGYLINPTYGLLFMDHVLFGQNTSTTSYVSAYTYIRSKAFDLEEYKTHIHDTLCLFYKLSGGFHGDLHLNNIVVILLKTTFSKHIKCIKLIDYESFTPFSSTSTSTSTLGNEKHSLSFQEYMSKTDDTFNKLKVLNSFKFKSTQHQGVPVKFTKHGQFVRSNTNMLKRNTLLFKALLNLNPDV
jgi:hypothetical protein